MCQLRERRLDLEEELAEEKKTSETLKKEYDALVKKAKIIDSALKTAEADLEAFQVTTQDIQMKNFCPSTTRLWSSMKFDVLFVSRVIVTRKDIFSCTSTLSLLQKNYWL